MFVFREHKLVNEGLSKSEERVALGGGFDRLFGLCLVNLYLYLNRS